VFAILLAVAENERDRVRDAKAIGPSSGFAQCLDRRINDPKRLISEIATWENNETPPAHASNGCSQPKKPAPKGAAPSPSRRKSRNHCADVLILPQRFASSIVSMDHHQQKWLLPR
jgi:hypothetical protein